MLSIAIAVFISSTLFLCFPCELWLNAVLTADEFPVRANFLTAIHDLNDRELCKFAHAVPRSRLVPNSCRLTIPERLV